MIRFEFHIRWFDLLSRAVKNYRISFSANCCDYKFPHLIAREDRYFKKFTEYLISCEITH